MRPSKSNLFLEQLIKDKKQPMLKIQTEHMADLPKIPHWKDTYKK
jgi:hypothetical protein